MTEMLYLRDHYMKEFDASVIKVEDNNKIILDRTTFYPESGGQPTDLGIIIRKSDNQKFTVLRVIKQKGEIVHEVVESGILVDDEVKGIIDWERRYILMRMHTAAHILSAVINKETGALITGNQLGSDKSRIDFDLENFDRDKIKEYFQKANEIVTRALPVKFYFMKREQAMEIPDVVKLAKALPPQVSELRLVEIEGVDLQADGGTQVGNTSEIGTIELVGIENKGKNNRRVYYKVL